MKPLYNFINESLIFEAKKWSKNKNINDILVNALGNKDEWFESPNKWLKAISDTFEYWYSSNDIKDIKWWATSGGENDVIELTSDDSIYDICYGDKEYEDDKYMDPCVIYTTDSFWGVEFYDHIIVCGKSEKTLKDISKEKGIKAAKEADKKRLEQERKASEEASKNQRRSEWKEYILSNTEDDPKWKQYQKYKGKVVKITVSWTGFNDDVTFFAVGGPSWSDWSPEFILPLTNEFKIQPKYMDWNWSTWGFEEYVKLSCTEIGIERGSVLSKRTLIIKDIKYATSTECDKYLKALKQAIDNKDIGSEFIVDYQYIEKLNK